MAFCLLTVQLSQAYVTTGKSISLTIQTFVSRITSLLFNTLSRCVIPFLPRSNHLLISWLKSPSTVILEPKRRKSITTSSFSPSICHEVMGLDAIIYFFLIFLIYSFKSVLSPPHLPSLGSSLVPLFFKLEWYHLIRVVSSTYLRLLMFLPPVLIPVCNSSSLAFFMRYSAHKLNKQGDSKQPCCTPFLILNQSIVPCQVPIVAS